MKKDLPKPKDIAKLLGITVEDMLSNIDNTSSASLSDLSKNNPNKYDVTMLGIVCKNLNLDISELIKYSELKEIIKNQDNLKEL